jgi:hypothetical protein
MFDIFAWNAIVLCASIGDGKFVALNLYYAIASTGIIRQIIGHTI